MLAPEAQAVFLTAGGAENDVSLRRLVTGPIQWDNFLIAAEWERSLPISWQRIAALSPTVPSDVAQSLDRLSAVCQFQSAVLRDRLEEFLRELARRDISVILLKGAAIALSKYGTFVERPMGDLDLLVAPEHCERAWDAAVSLGWSWDEGQYPRDRYSQHHHAPPLMDGARTGVKLELHTALSLPSHPFAFSYNEALAVSVRVPGYSADVRMLDAEHSFLHVCIHFAWAHLATFGLWRLARDVQALARGGAGGERASEGGLDWVRVAALAERYRAQRGVYWSLALASGVCGVSVAPLRFMNELRPAGSAVLHGLIARHMAAHVVARTQPCPSEKFRRVMWSLAMDPSGTSGALRPWEESPPPTRGYRAASRLTRLQGQLGQLGAWGAYLRSMLSL